MGLRRNGARAKVASLGRRLPCRDHPGMTTRPDPLVCLPDAAPRARLLWFPALGVPAAKYRRFGEALAARGIAVGVHEWRGTGACPWRAGRKADWGYREWLLEDVPASLEAFHTLAGAEAAAQPMVFGGHSIGGQIAVLAAALGLPAAGLVIVASGIPYWRLFPGVGPRLAVGGFGATLPLLTRLFGYYPGHRLGFAGREAGQLMRDWAGTVRRGCYGGLTGLPGDLDQRIAALRQPVLGLRFDADWLVPAASLEALLQATGSADREHQVLTGDALGVRGDHFAWLRSPEAPAARLAAWWAARSGLSS